MESLRTEIARIATSYIGKGRDSFGCDRDAWCGAFVCHVLRSAGLAVETAKFDPGDALCRGLAIVTNPAVGDIVEYCDGLSHYALVTALVAPPRGVHYPAGVCIVEGASDNDLVKGRVMGAGRPFIDPPTPDHTWKRRFRSIESLLERYQWTGAPTGEVA